MKISVIVPVYNTAQFLPRCIESILSQSFTDFELLLIDDGSTDGSGAICDEYAKKDYRIRVFHQENQGSAASRQFGFEKAKGLYITSVDSDDWVESQYLESLVNIADNDCSDLVMGAYYIDRGCDRTIVANKPSGLEVTAWQRDFLGHKCHAGMPNKLIRKSVFKRGYAVPKYDYYEDMLISVSYLESCHKLSYCPDASYHYCVNENSMTQKKNVLFRAKCLEEMLRNLQDLCAYLPESKYVELEQVIYDCVNVEKIRILEEYPNDYEAYRGLFREWFPKSYSIRKVKGLTTCCRYLALKGIGWPYRLCVAHSR